MAKDFRASQVELTKIILSGGIANTTVGGILYSGSSATDREGGLASGMLSSVGKDVTFFVSGAKDVKNHPPISNVFKQGVVLFGGDVVVSGTLFADRQVVEVDETVTGSMLISGSLSVSQSATINKGLEVNKSMGSADGLGGDDFIHFGTTVGKEIIASHASTDQLFILSGGAPASTNSAKGNDIAFYVSGTISSMGTTNKGTSLFGGDLVVSGGLDVHGTTLVVDEINNNVGIGVDDPTSKLEIFSTSTQLKLSYNTDDYSTLGVGSNGDLTITTHDQAGTSADFTVVADGAVDIDANAGSLSLDGSTAINIGTEADVPVTIDSAAFDVNASGVVTVDAVGTSNITTHGILTLSGSDGLNVASDEGEIDLTSRQGAIDVNAGAALSLDGASGINIGTAANVAVDINASTLDIDATGALTIDSATSIAIGTNADKPIDIDSTTLDIDASGELTIDAVGTSNITTHGTLTISGSDGVNIASDEGEIDLTTRQGAVDINAHTGVTIDATAGNISIIADGTSNSVTIKGDNTNGTSIHLDGNQHANAVVLIDAGQLNVDAMSTVSIDTETTFSIDGITGNSNITQQKGTLLISGSAGLVLDSHGGPISIASTQAPVTINGEQVLILSGGGPTSPNEALYPDTNFFVSGTAGSRGTATRGTSVFGGDVVISGSLFGGSPLSVGGDLEVSGSVILTGDSPTEITGSLFITGSMAVTGSLTVSGSSTFTVYGPSIFNEGGVSDSDFRVETDNKTHAIFVNSATNQVLILSGGVGGRGATSPDTAKGADVAVYISGSSVNLLDAPIGLGSNVSLFDGDLVISGAIRGTNRSMSSVNPVANDLVLYSNGTNYSFGKSHSILADTSSTLNPGLDIFLFVSGSARRRGIEGVTVLGGDAIISGSLRARQLHFTTHRFTPGDTQARFVRFDKDGSDPGAGADNKMVTPYIGELVKVVARCSANAGDVAIAFHRGSDGSTNVGSAIESVTEAMGTVDTGVTFNFTQVANWGPSDIIGLSVNPGSDPGDVVLTAVWEFETY
tara:strand:+ start:1146 stop:4229 length:3084 start_codon:yes stop_codon:yes gene_type:complete